MVNEFLTIKIRMAYHNQSEKLRKEKRTRIRRIWHEIRSIHDEAFNCTTSSVEEFIMNGDHVPLRKSLI